MNDQVYSWAQQGKKVYIHSFDPLHKFFSPKPGEIFVGGDEMRRVQGIQKLISYLESVNYPVAEKDIYDLTTNKKLPHKKVGLDIIIFDLDQIDWWIEQDQT